jgi:hypothetical protein
MSLLDSDIFLFQFDSDLWPSIHINNKELQKPYNGSLFELPLAYNKIFPESEFGTDVLENIRK